MTPAPFLFFENCVYHFYVVHVERKGRVVRFEFDAVGSFIRLRSTCSNKLAAVYEMSSSDTKVYDNRYEKGL